LRRGALRFVVLRRAVFFLALRVVFFLARAISLSLRVSRYTARVGAQCGIALSLGGMVG
jgi:hypothetical protein